MTIEYDAMEKLLDEYMQSIGKVGYIMDARYDDLVYELYHDESLQNRIESLIFGEIKDRVRQELDYETQARARELKADLFGQDIEELEKFAEVWRENIETLGYVFFGRFDYDITEITELEYLHALKKEMLK